MFITSDAIYCPISSYEVVKADGNSFTASDPEYARFLLATSSDESLSIDTNLADPG